MSQRWLLIGVVAVVAVYLVWQHGDRTFGCEGCAERKARMREWLNGRPDFG